MAINLTERFADLERRGKVTPKLRQMFSDLQRRGIVSGGERPQPASGQPDFAIPPIGQDFNVSGQQPPIDQTKAITAGQRVQPLATTPIDELSFQQKVLRNIPSSGLKFANDIVTPILHPVETVQSIVSLAKGIVQKVTPGIQPDEASVDALVKFFGERFGSIDAIKNTLETDPVGFVGDVSTVFAGLGAVAKVGKLGKFAEVTKAIGKAIDPIANVGKVIKPITSKAGTVGKQILGITTGAGAEAIEQAFKGSPDFVKALKGEISEGDVLRTTKGALNEIKQARSLEYVTRLEDVTKAVGNIDIKPLKDSLKGILKKFRIDEVDGVLDLKNSTINRNAWSDVTSIVETIRNWENKPGNLTAIGLDTLKRRLDDFYSESKNTRAMVSELRNKVKNMIIAKVPAYKTMVTEYAVSSDFIKEIERSLSIGDKAQLDTGVRKLSSIMRENFEFRKSLIEKLEASTGADIKGQIAGLTLKPITPRGLVGKLFGGSVIFQGISLMDPKLALMLAASSPRVVAEFVNVLGIGIREAQKVGKFLPLSQATFQAGRVERIQQEDRR